MPKNNVDNYIERTKGPDGRQNRYVFNGVIAFNDVDLVASSDDINIITLNLLISYDEIQVTGGLRLLEGIPGYSFRCLDIILGVSGTNFTTGDWNFSISDTSASTFFTTLPSSVLLTQVNSRWGTTDVPYPFAQSANKLVPPGLGIRIIKGGGAVDYDDGILDITLRIQAVKV